MRRGSPRLQKKTTVLVCIVAVTLLGLGLLAKRRELLEAYYLHVFQHGDQAAAASAAERLAALESTRALAPLVDRLIDRVAVGDEDHCNSEEEFWNKCTPAYMVSAARELMKRLEGADRAERLTILAALQFRKDAAPQVVPSLLAFLTAEPHPVREEYAIITALMSIGASAEVVESLLVERLSADNEERRVKAAFWMFVLCRTEPLGTQGIVALKSALNDPVVDVCLWAAYCLAICANDGSERVLQVLGAALKGTDKRGDLPCRALARLGNRATDVVLDFLKADSSAIDRWHAVDILRKTCPASARAADVLRKISENEAEAEIVRGAARSALRCVEAKLKPRQK